MYAICGTIFKSLRSTTNAKLHKLTELLANGRTKRYF